MAKLELNLHTKTGDVLYSEHHVSGQKYLDLMNLKIEFEENDKLNVVDIITKRVAFTADLFTDKAVTPQTLLEGIDPWDLIPTLDRIEEAVVGTGDVDEKKEQ